MMRYDDQRTVASLAYIERSGPAEPDSLADAIAQQPEPPCGLCKHFDRCAEHKLACKAFFGYTMFPSAKETYFDWETMDRIPTAKIYAKTFRLEDL